MNVGYFAANLTPPNTGLETIYIVYIFAVIVFQCENNWLKIFKLHHWFKYQIQKESFTV